ncbi:caspase family protein [Bradyrhizobium sp. 27S5]|uniref:caspase family protein n=1 Tax=Bradyrhizobium sp. 27S5 TaxID=3139728 RepID=UPI0030D5BB98
MVGDGTNALTLYYFAGHGFAIGQESFIVGDGAEQDSKEALKTSSLTQSSILAGLHSRGAPVIAILDMCRSQLSIVDAEGHRALNEKPLDGYQAISKVPGLLVHYSTSPNEYAADLPAQANGLYAHVFLEQTPNQPGLSAEQLLNDIVGKMLADGLQIEGKTYKQFPNLVAYPDDWTKIQIFDAASASRLDSVMSAVIQLNSMVENGPGAIALACRMAIEIKDEWKAAPDPIGSHTTVAQMLERIARLLQRMKDKGYPCPDILSTKAASAPVTLPPLAHVAKTAVVLSAAGQTAGSYDLAKVGTWLTTNSVSLPLNVTKAGTFATIARAPVKLESAFVSASKITAAPAASDVYFTPIDGDNARLVDTKDQIVVRFMTGGSDLIDPDKVVAAIKKVSNGPTKLVFVILPPNKPSDKNYLDRLRLSSVRALSVVRQITKAGIPYGQIVAPGEDQQASIQIYTLQADEALIKIVGTSSTSFDALGKDSLNPTAATGAAKQNLDIYETMTRFTKG